MRAGRLLFLWNKMHEEDRIMNISFSSPNVTEPESGELKEAIGSGWIL